MVFLDLTCLPDLLLADDVQFLQSHLLSRTQWLGCYGILIAFTHTTLQVGDEVVSAYAHACYSQCQQYPSQESPPPDRCAVNTLDVGDGHVGRVHLKWLYHIEHQRFAPYGIVATDERQGLDIEERVLEGGQRQVLVVLHATVTEGGGIYDGTVHNLNARNQVFAEHRHLHLLSYLAGSTQMQVGLVADKEGGTIYCGTNHQCQNRC